MKWIIVWFIGDVGVFHPWTPLEFTEEALCERVAQQVEKPFRFVVDGRTGLHLEVEAVCVKVPQ